MDTNAKGLSYFGRHAKLSNPTKVMFRSRVEMTKNALVNVQSSGIPNLNLRSAKSELDNPHLVIMHETITMGSSHPLVSKQMSVNQ